MTTTRHGLAGPALVLVLLSAGGLRTDDAETRAVQALNKLRQ